MRVPVLDTHRTPLMPATPARARLLLKQGKAKPYWNKLGIFCIILTYEVQPDNQPLVVGIDPGSSYEGWAAVGTKETVLNGMSEAPTHVPRGLRSRKVQRRTRRTRACWRRPIRRNRKIGKAFLPPSTFARWNAKVRILDQLQKILPVTAVVVEDVAAWTKKNCRRWNTCFSPLAAGKQWFYTMIRDRGLALHLCAGYETKDLRDRFGLAKTCQKNQQTFSAHAVDAWVMAASVSGAERPTDLGLYYWAPLRWHRRQLHYRQPGPGGVRRPYGGTRSLGFTRGTLVRHPRHGFTLVRGTSRGRISLHHPVTGKLVTTAAKPEDLHPLTTIRWTSRLCPVS
jgi:hypothetical protein